ncbi:MAG: helix-turn-helix domain-containing protein [Litoreibacter sp.]
MRNEFASFGNILPAVGKDARLGFRNFGTAYILGKSPFIRFQSEAFRLLPRSKTHPSVLDTTPWAITVPLRGTARYVSNRSCLRQSPGKVLISEPAKSLYGRVTDCEFLVLLLAEEEIMGLDRSFCGYDGCDNPRTVHPLLGHYLTALANTIETIASDEAEAIADATISIIRACISQRPMDIEAAEAPIKKSRLVAAQKYIYANLRSPDLSSDAVSEFLNVSRRRLHDIFEQTEGVQTYIREQRLKAAFNQIVYARGSRSVTSVAREFRFSNLANFSRAFKVRFGLTPTELENQACQAKLSNFEQWTLDLRS